MRILVLDEEFPWPLNTGKRLRSYNLISRLARQHEVGYLAYGEESSDSYRHFASNRLNPIAVPPHVPSKEGLAFYIRLLMNLFSCYPYIVQSHYSASFAIALERAVQSSRPDIILCEWTPYAIFAREVTAIPVIISAHNIETRIWERYLEAEGNPLRRWYIGRQIPKVRRFEQETFGRVKGVIAVSSLEADDIRRIAKTCRVEVVDNGVDLTYFNSSAAGSNSNSAVFTGSMDWRPNQDSAHYFCKDILPLIQNKLPDFAVTFVGRTPPQSVLDLQKIKGVSVTGTVDDVRPYIENAGVYIVPLRIGGGSRLKILEALAMKKAVVSTTIGAEGLHFRDNEHLQIADTPEAFAKEVVRLIGDPSLRMRLGEAGRSAVEQSYGWDALAARLEKFLNSVGAL
jgi:polysaccharide biosynthesis protein PslH